MIDKTYERLIFLHIPKTGGTSMHEVIPNMIRLDNFAFNDPSKTNYLFHLYKTPEYFETRVQYVHIHEWIPFNMFNKFTFKPTDFVFTFIRHPISHFYSLYHHKRREYNERNYEEKMDQFREECSLSLYRSIVFTSRNIREFIDWILDFGDIFSASILPKGYMDESFLNRCNFVGIFENYSESLDILKTMSGFQQITEKKENVNEYLRDYSYRYDELCELFANEITIYNKYKAEFNRLLSSIK